MNFEIIFRTNISLRNVSPMESLKYKINLLISYFIHYISNFFFFLISHSAINKLGTQLSHATVIYNSLP